MAVTWTIAQLDRNSSDDGVIVAHYRCNDTEVVGTGDNAVASLWLVVWDLWF